MAEEFGGFFSKDGQVLKPPKKSYIALRMCMLAAVMICGIYIFSICLKQVGSQNNHRILKFNVIEELCSLPQSLVPYVHYPKPSTYNRDECACTPVRFFVILSMQRSGSGWFETLLNSHINISSNGEIFYANERRNNVSSIIKILDKVYNLDWYSSSSKNECTAAFGFKWMLNQGVMANHEEIAKYFSKRGVSLIFLFRRNPVRRFVSKIANDHDRINKQLNGTHKAHVHSEHEAQILASYKPKVNTPELVSYINETNKLAADALNHFKNIRRIVFYYEDLVQNRTKLMDALDFLGVPRRKLSSRHVKIHTKPISELVENWNDVYNALKGSQNEMFLNADYRR